MCTSHNDSGFHLGYAARFQLQERAMQACISILHVGLPEAIGGHCVKFDAGLDEPWA